MIADTVARVPSAPETRDGSWANAGSLRESRNSIPNDPAPPQPPVRATGRPYSPQPARRTRTRRNGGPDQRREGSPRRQPSRRGRHHARVRTAPPARRARGTACPVGHARQRGALQASSDHADEGLLVSAAPALREGLRSLPTNEQLTRCARLRISPTQEAEQHATRSRSARAPDERSRLQKQAQELEAEIKPIIARLAPCLLAEIGVGAIVAAQILCAYSHPGRIRSEAAFASLAGVAPIPASSGQTVRHRLNRSGDRQLNRALHTIVLCRMRDDARTRAYTARRQAERTQHPRNQAMPQALHRTPPLPTTPDLTTKPRK